VLRPDEQQRRAIRTWAEARKRVAGELCDRATGAAGPEAAELKARAERLRAQARQECEQAAVASPNGEIAD
jgi:hypothetical protein